MLPTMLLSVHSAFVFRAPAAVFLKMHLQVVQKETDESMEMDSSLDFCGIPSTKFALGLFAPSHPIREFAQAVVHSNWYYWAVCLSSVAATIVPCLKGKVDGFDNLDSTLTCAFGASMIVEVLLKSIADGFLWVMPTLVKQELNSAAVSPEDVDQDSVEQAADTMAAEADPLETPIDEMGANEGLAAPKRSMWGKVVGKASEGSSSMSTKYLVRDAPTAPSDDGTGTGTGSGVNGNDLGTTEPSAKPGRRFSASATKVNRKFSTNHLDAMKQSYSVADKVSACSTASTL